MEPAILEVPGKPSVSGSSRSEQRLKQFSCPSCGRTYAMQEGVYMCAQNHGYVAQSSGIRRNVVIQEWGNPEVPWEIPEMVEEREARRKDLVVAYLYKCNHPGNRDYSDLAKHLFGVGHLTMDMVRRKYSEYVLRPLEVPLSVQDYQPTPELSPVKVFSKGEDPSDIQRWEAQTEEPTSVETSSQSADLSEIRKKELVLFTGLSVSLAVMVTVILHLLNVL